MAKKHMKCLDQNAVSQIRGVYWTAFFNPTPIKGILKEF